jgi:hypothetical protein
MTATPATNFLGIPIDGDIHEGDRKVLQRPIADLEPLIRAVLADDGIVEFGWTQYTPYFNDGDPCVFSVGDPWFRSAADEASDSEYDDDTYELWNHPTLGKRDRRYNHDTCSYDYGPYEGPNEARYDRCNDVREALYSGAFDNVLLEAFGDHARVTVRKDRISVDEYSHD